MNTVGQFFRSWFNWALTAVLCLPVIILAIVVPTVDVRRFWDKAQAARPVELSRYAAIKSSFPDPCIIHVNNTWFAFATQATSNINVQVASAPTISDWTLHADMDALPYLPTWAKAGDAAVWAPSVVQRPDGAFVMYFAASHYIQTGKHCIGAAVASTITGPYQPLNEPLVCNFDLGGVIDPDFFHDPITNISTVLYKNDGNAIGSGGACSNSNWPNTATNFQYLLVDNTYYTNPLGGDAANKTSFLTNGRSDGPNIEAPAMSYHSYDRATGQANVSAYHLVYNAGCFADTSYRIEHIVCWPGEVHVEQGKNDTFGFRSCDWMQYKSADNSHNIDLLLQTSNYTQLNGDVVQLYAPGGPDVSLDGRYMVFHADTDPTWFAHREERGLRNRSRSMFIAELEYSGQDTGMRIKQLVLPDA